MASFVWSEAIFVTLGGVILGVSGWGISLVIVKILTGVFDPPPPHLFVQWAYLADLAGVTGGVIGTAGSGVIRATRRPAIEIVGISDHRRRRSPTSSALRCRTT